MASCTDTFELNNTKLFEKIRNSLPDDKTKTQNLLESKDDLLFVWDSSDCSLLVTNWRAAKIKGFDIIKYQTLLPSTPQNFQVDKILCSPEGSLIALAGCRGLTILELPRRWGPNGQFLEGKERIICRSHNLDEQFFINNTHLELLQIRWHPASPTDSHILALLSDNSIRVYDDSTLKHVWRVGPIPCPSNNINIIPPTVSSNVKFLNSLGETAVDFDIAPPRVVLTSKYDDLKDSKIINSTSLIDITSTTDTTNINTKRDSTRKVEWPIVLLRGNGNIYILCASIDTDKPRLQGPLTMLPQTDNNYGVDSCSILVIPSLPPALIIAESTGKLHHGLLLECEIAEESFNEIDSSIIIHPSEWTVNILETVELELGLQDSKKSKSHTCSIHLKRDFINELRYFAYHNTGLHVVTMNFIKHLQQFVDSDDSKNPPTLSKPSHAEYIVCTKALDSNKINAVLGFVLLQMPSGVIILLSSGQVISLNLIIDPNLLTDYWLDDTTKKSNIKMIDNTPLQKVMSQSFITYIQNILKSSITQPILSLDKTSEPTSQECYELLTQAIQVLREQYFKKHEKARVEITKRVNILKLLKEQQKHDLEQLELEKEKIRENAESLAEKYEDIYDKQMILSKKCQELVRQSNMYLPNNTMADKEFAENVEKINKKALEMQSTLEQAQKKISNQKLRIKKYADNTENKIIELPEKQENVIKECLSQITSEIDQQIKEIKRINNIINL